MKESLKRGPSSSGLAAGLALSSRFTTSELSSPSEPDV